MTTWWDCSYKFDLAEFVDGEVKKALEDYVKNESTLLLGFEKGVPTIKLMVADASFVKDFKLHKELVYSADNYFDGEKDKLMQMLLQAFLNWKKQLPPGWEDEQAKLDDEDAE